MNGSSRKTSGQHTLRVSSSSARYHCSFGPRPVLTKAK
jgi:hypothetical protein